MQNKRKAVVAALGATAVGAAVVVTGASSAYFHDTENVDGNRIEAGTLDLDYQLTGSAVENGRISLADVKPGDAKTFTVKVTNAGSVKGYVSAKVADAVNAENEIWEPEAQWGDKSATRGELGDKMRISFGTRPSLVSFDLNDVEWVVNKYLPSLPLKTGESSQVTFTVWLPNLYRGDYNTVMSDSYAFDLDLALSQK